MSRLSACRPCECAGDPPYSSCHTLARVICELPERRGGLRSRGISVPVGPEAPQAAADLGTRLVGAVEAAKPIDDPERAMLSAR